MGEPGDGVLERTDVLSDERVLAGKYELGAQIGEGGMGSVYLAQHRDLETTVAVKLLGEAFVEHPTAIARFRREAKALAATRHENIVQVMDFGTDDDLGPYLVMELLKGESLHSLLGRKGSLVPKIAARVIIQILDGLEAVHERGIIHRDLKPANVFLTERPGGRVRVKILDFGISKFLDADEGDHKTATGAIVGTPKYLAPEQIHHTTVPDERTDLYAVGVCFYRMLTGRLPYKAKERTGLFDEIVQGKIIEPQLRKPDLPDALVEIVMRALAQSPEDRFASAADMRSAIQGLFPDAPSSSNLTGETGDPSTGLKLSLHPSSRPASSQADTRIDASRPSETPPLPVVPQPSLGTGVNAPASRGFLVAALAVVAIVAAAASWYAANRNVAESEGPAATGDLEAESDGPSLSGAPLLYGVQLFADEEDVRARHEPVRVYLERRLRRPVQLELWDDFEDIATKTLEGQVDLAALSAYHYVRASAQNERLRLLARARPRGGETYSGVILVRADSEIRELGEFRNRDFCFVGRNSTSGYIYPSALFRRARIDPETAFRSVRYEGDHVDTLRALAAGACDGAAVSTNVWHDNNPERFHMVASTERIPFDAYCVGSDVDTELARELQSALLALEPGSALAEEVFADAPGDLIGFVAASDADYREVREVLEFIDP